MPKEEYELEFTVADENDEIYKDKKIYAVTMTNPNPPRRVYKKDWEDTNTELKHKAEIRKRITGK